MIVRDKPSALQLFFVMRGSVVPLILPKILVITLLGLWVALAQDYFPSFFPAYTLAPFVLLGAALSLFLSFRNNACYERWREARQQWGQLIVDARSLSRQLTSFIDARAEGGLLVQQRLIKLTIAFSHALRHRLRGSDPWGDIEDYLDPEDVAALRQSQNLPNALLRLMGGKLGCCRHKQLLSDYLIQNVGEHITSMVGVQAACERIKNTPLPFAYRLLVQRTAYLYCLLLPFFLAPSQVFLTPLFCVIVTYTFFGLDALSDELEYAFGVAANDLPLTALSRTIEIDLLETLGLESLPEPIKPRDDRLE